MGVKAIEIAGLTFAYPRGGHRLQNVSLAVGEAEICCLLGPNGAGKTTLLRCLVRLLTADSGTIRLQGREIGSLSARQLAQRVAYVPQSASTPFSFTALDIAVMGRTPHLDPFASPSSADRQFALGHLDGLGIGHLADRVFSHLSGGERQLTLLARALVQEAPVLVLDEPAAALDYGNEVRLLQTVASLARGGKSILMTTHQPAHALGHAGRAALMREGKMIAYGDPREVLTGQSLSELYGVPIHVGMMGLPGNRHVSSCVAVPPEGPETAT